MSVHELETVLKQFQDMHERLQRLEGLWGSTKKFFSKAKAYVKDKVLDKPLDQAYIDVKKALKKAGMTSVTVKKNRNNIRVDINKNKTSLFWWELHPDHKIWRILGNTSKANTWQNEEFMELEDALDVLVEDVKLAYKNNNGHVDHRYLKRKEEKKKKKQNKQIEPPPEEEEEEEDNSSNRRAITASKWNIDQFW